MMTVNQLFKLYAAYSEGKTIMCKTEEYHSGYYNSHWYENTEEVDFGELSLESLVDVDEYSCDGEVHDQVKKSFFIKGEEPKDDDEEEEVENE